MSHDPGGEDGGPVDVFRLQLAAAKNPEAFAAAWFGKRDDESLGEAMLRRAQEPNPVMAAFVKAAKK